MKLKLALIAITALLVAILGTNALAIQNTASGRLLDDLYKSVMEDPKLIEGIDSYAAAELAGYIAQRGNAIRDPQQRAEAKKILALLLGKSRAEAQGEAFSVDRLLTSYEVLKHFRAYTFQVRDGKMNWPTPLTHHVWVTFAEDLLLLNDDLLPRVQVAMNTGTIPPVSFPPGPTPTPGPGPGIPPGGDIPPPPPWHDIPPPPWQPPPPPPPTTVIPVPTDPGGGGAAPPPPTPEYGGPAELPDPEATWPRPLSLKALEIHDKWKREVQEILDRIAALEEKHKENPEPGDGHKMDDLLHELEKKKKEYTDRLNASVQPAEGLSYTIQETQVVNTWEYTTPELLAAGGEGIEERVVNAERGETEFYVVTNGETIGKLQDVLAKIDSQRDLAGALGVPAETNMITASALRTPANRTIGDVDITIANGRIAQEIEHGLYEKIEDPLPPDLPPGLPPDDPVFPPDDPAFPVFPGDPAF